MAARCLLAALLLFPATPAFALQLRDFAELGDASGRTTAADVRVATLADGHVVGAWTSPGTGDLTTARARVFDAEGQPSGSDAFCTQPETSPPSFRARVAPVGDGFMLGCDVFVHQSSLGSEVRLQRFHGDGTAAGEPADLDQHFITQIGALVSSSSDSFVASVLECSGTCDYVSRILDDDGVQLGKIPEPGLGFQRLEPLDGGNFLAMRFGETSVHGKASLSLRIFSADGKRIGPKRRLARVALSTSAMQTAKGPDGRIAVKWDTVRARSGVQTHVVIFDSTGNQIGEEQVLADRPIEENPIFVAFALPLESGFVLLGYYGSSMFAQAYSSDGVPVGSRSDLSPGPALIDSVTYVEAEHAYVIGGLRVSTWPSPSIAALWRLDLRQSR